MSISGGSPLPAALSAGWVNRRRSTSLASLTIRIDHRTLEAQGIDRAPSVHKRPAPGGARAARHSRARATPARGGAGARGAGTAHARCGARPAAARARRDPSIDSGAVDRHRRGAAGAGPDGRGAEPRTPAPKDAGRSDRSSSSGARTRAAPARPPKEKTKERSPSRARDKDRDGPDYER